MKVDMPRAGDFDVLIVEGTLSGCYLAAKFSAGGQRTAILISGTSPGYEYISCLRPWIFRKDSESIPDPIGSIVRSSLTPAEPSEDETLIHLGRFTQNLEDILLDAKVVVFYSASPVAALINDGSIIGIVAGGKFGLTCITASTVIDCTPDATVARICGVPFLGRENAFRGITVEYILQRLVKGNKKDDEIYRSLESESGVGEEVKWHKNFLQLRYSIPQPLKGFFTVSDLEKEIRLRGIETVLRLHEKSPDLFFLRGAERILIRQPMVPKRKGKSLAEAVMMEIGPKGLLLCGPAAATVDNTSLDLTDHPLNALRDIKESFPEIQNLVRSIHRGSNSTAETRIVTYAGAAEGTGSTFDAKFDCSQISFCDPYFKEPGIDSIVCTFEGVEIIESGGLVVAGGGTSGFVCALEAARAGIDTICVEKHCDLGGVHTLGGVPYYWFGKWNPYFRRHYRSLHETIENTGLPVSLAQLKLLTETDARLHLSTPVVGVARSGRSLEGLLIFTDLGLRAIKGDFFIDATGDGDLAAWAGNPYTYGTHRDEMTMWCSFGKFSKDRREASRQYHTVCDQRSLRDTSRAIIAGRRQPGIFGEAEYPQVSLAVRESRHISGSITVTYPDMLSKRCFADSLMICKSNVDIKGMASSAAAMCGFIERNFLRNYECYIPFRSIAPIKWGNLLITGRAYSITHDGLSLARMQADMATLGAVTATIVEFRVKTPHPSSTTAIPVEVLDLSYSESDLTALQEMMISKGIMEHFDLIRRERPDDFPDDDEIEILCERLAMGPLELGDQARIMQRPDIAVEFLLNTIKRSESAGSRLTAARILGLLRNSGGVPILLEAIYEELRGATLPGLRTPSFHPLPDHGWAPDVVYYINAVSRTRDSRLVPVLSSVAERVNLNRRVSDQGFAYVHSIAYSCEQMADAAVIPVLEKLLMNPVIQGNAVRLGEDPRNTTDPIRERYAYLEFCLYRALARCGSVKGYRGLVSYLNEQRLFLSRGAYNELLELTGHDAGFDVDEWNVIIDENVSKFIPRPVKDNIDWS